MKKHWKIVKQNRKRCKSTFQVDLKLHKILSNLEFQYFEPMNSDSEATLRARSRLA